MTSIDSNALQSIALHRLGEVRHRTGLSRSEIYRRIAVGDFPKPIKIGERASAWVAHEITAWIIDRVASRDTDGSR